MNTFAPKVAIQPAARQPLPFGLFSVFQAQSSADRWLAGGVAWETLNCNAAVGLSLSAQVNTEDPVHNFEHGREVSGEALPFSVAGYHERTLLGTSEADAKAKAEEQLLLHEQRRVEQALWSGDLDNEPSIFGSDNTDRQDLGSAGLIEALAALEDFIATELGFIGVLHMPRRLASIFASNRFIEARGGRMLTKLDTPVVVGAGYSGDSIAVTPPIFGYRSDVDVWNVADTQKNNSLTVASRDYILAYDPCGTASIEVQLDTDSSNGGGTSSEVTIVGSSVPLPVEVQNDTVNVSGSVEVSNTVTTNVSNTERTITGVADVNVTNEELNVRTVTDETP